MADALTAWMKASKHLPDVMRDFHDQKDLFKAMHELQQPSGPTELEGGAFTLDFITGQCYVIDRFLWFMARRGYTLQRSRTRLPFRDLQADVKAAKEKRDAHDMALLSAHLSGGAEPPASSALDSSASGSPLRKGTRPDEQTPAGLSRLNGGQE